MHSLVSCVILHKILFLLYENLSYCIKHIRLVSIGVNFTA